MTKEESIKNSREKYNKIKEKQQKTKDERKAGIKFIHDNRIRTFKFTPSMLTVCVAYVCEEDSISFSFCIQSLKDTYSKSIAKGLLGNRMKNKDEKFYHKLEIPHGSDLIKSDKNVQMFLAASFISNAIVNKNIPDCLRNDIRQLEDFFFSIGSL